MARTKQMERKTNTGLPKASLGGKDGKGGKGGKGGGGGGGGAVGGSDGNRNAKGKVPSGRFSQQLENRPPAAALSVKSHTYMLSRKCGNYSILQNYVYRNIRWQGRSF